MAPDYYIRLWAWAEEHRGVIFDWLLSRNLCGFNPDAPPPLTEGKRRMVEASRDDTEVLIAELIDFRNPPFEQDLVELDPVLQMIRDKSPGMSVTRPMLARALRANGATNLGQKTGMVDSIEKRKSLWAVRDAEGYRKLSAQDIIERFFRQHAVLVSRPKQCDTEIDL